MKIPSAIARTRETLQVEMTPMIDVVFLLLIFFIWTASFRIAEQLLPSQVREETAEGSGTDDTKPLVDEDFESVIVRIGWENAQPTWTINGNSVARFAQIAEVLASVKTIKPDVTVIVDPAAIVPLGYVIDAYDLTRGLGFAEVQFAADPSVP